MAQTLLGNAHTRASPAALTGQPWCVSIPVVGAFIAGAVPTNSRNANEPPQMASPAAPKQYPNGPCVCSTTSHAPALSPHHLLTYRNEGMLGRRHDDLRRTLRDMATTAGLIAEEEPRGLPGFGQGGGDLLIHDLHPRQSIIADVCVVSEHVDALAETAASHAGHAAKVAERRKHQKYRPACDQLGLGFMPLAIENDGALGKELQAFIRRCNEVALGMPIAGTTWAASSFAAY